MADTLRQRLNRLFSGNVIIRNTGGRKLKVVDTDQVQSRVNRNFLDRYTRLYSSIQGSTGKSIQFYQADQRMALFRDYEQMDSDSILSSALDVYADESTLKSEYGNVIEVNSENPKVVETLHNLYYDIMNVEFNLWPWVRNLTKYGDFYLHLQIHEKYGVYNVIPLSAYDVVRYEGLNPMKPNEVKFQIGEGDARHMAHGNQNMELLDEFEVAHFRLIGDSNYLPYGKSMMEGARKTWKQLTLMEDAMLIHRIMRAPEKRIFKIDIGGLGPAEVEPFMQKIIAKMKKTPVIDRDTGEYNLRFNMQNMTEDFFLPVRGGDSGTEIDTLQGMQMEMTEDIEYLRNRMMAALKVPKAFLGYDEALNSKATLAAEDVRFARTIERIQRTLISELTKIGLVHLYVQGFKAEDLVDFELNLTNPSMIYEEEKIELWNNKVGLASSIKQDSLMDTEWIYDNIFNFDSDTKNKIRLGLLKDKKREFRYQQLMDEGNDPLKSGEAVGTQGAMMDAGADDSTIRDTNMDDFNEEWEQVPDDIGRPPEGPKFGKDGSARGRDPLGAHDMKKGGSNSRKYGKPLALAHYDSLKKKLGSKFEENKRIITEVDDISNEYKNDVEKTDED